MHDESRSTASNSEVGTHAKIAEVTHLQHSSQWTQLLRSQEFWISISVLVLGLVVSIIAPNFATSSNLGNVLQNFCFIGLLAIGATPIIIIGGIDISIGSLMGLCGVCLGLLLNADWSLIPALAVTLLLGIVLGGINGALVALVRLPPFLVTLGTMSIFRSLAIVVSNNQVVYSFGHEESRLFEIGGGRTFGLPNVLFALIFAVIVLQTFLIFSRWGRHLKAVGGNEAAALVNGIPVRGIKISAYCFGGFMGAVAAIFLVGWLGSVSNSLGQGDELRVIASAVIGGASLAGGYGTAFGAAVGSLLIEEIRNALLLAKVDPYWQGTFVGVFILAAIVLQRLRNPGSN